MKAMNMLSQDKTDFSGKTYADFMAMMIGEKDPSNIREKVADYLGSGYNTAIKALDWLGFFEDKPMNRGEDSPFEITSDLMIEKMMIGEEERDMVVLQHTFLASYPTGNKEVIKSTMVDYGTLNTDTAIARTVSLPAACGVEMLLKGEIEERGVHIPVIPGIYNPILDTLETLDIKMVEEFGLPMSENIG
jgi:saccharopine dehydrogenase-like NADP-dependent oxidoreductase